jgi:hypothetical protein
MSNSNRQMSNWRAHSSIKQIVQPGRNVNDDGPRLSAILRVWSGHFAPVPG